VGRLDPVFKARLSIREAQVIQEHLDLIRVRYVPAEGFSEADARSIITALQARMGTVQVVLEEVGAIPRAGGGKFRAVVSQVDRSELQRVQS
jgi:phenylacetate-CoA ligase